jgi:hypothetical protein
VTVRADGFVDSLMPEMLRRSARSAGSNRDMSAQAQSDPGGSCFKPPARFCRSFLSSGFAREYRARQNARRPPKCDPAIFLSVNTGNQIADQ